MVDDVGLGQGLGEEVTADATVHAIAESGGLDRALARSARPTGRSKVAQRHVGVAAGDDDRQLAGGAARVAERLVLRRSRTAPRARWNGAALRPRPSRS